MPFRGPTPLLKEHEYQAYTQTVHDGRVRLFDWSNPVDAQDLQTVVDRAVNGWFQIYSFKETVVTQQDGSVKVYVFVVWSEPWKEFDRGRGPAGRP
jgi:hypothetical protein